MTEVLTGELGGYRLLRQIGEGGMGVVHLAVASDDSRVAVKVLRPGIVGDTESRERLSREVSALRRVQSPRVAECVGADPWGARPYVVTRFVAGISLAEYVREYGPLSGDQLRRIAIGLAEALEAVHRVGVVHRDVKPSNVLLERDDPVLIDFGLAMAADESRMTQAGWLLGTPAYLAPEIVLGQYPTDRADIHSWAATIAFACTGRGPYGGGPSVAVIDRIRRGEHDLSGVPDGLRGVLERCLAPDPRLRPTAAELTHWLQEERTPVHTPVDTNTRPVTVAVDRDDLWGQEPVRPAVERMLRWGSAGAIAMLVAALASVLPYAVALIVLLVSAGVRADRRVRSQRWERTQRRGPRRTDPTMDLIRLPWAFVSSLPAALLTTLAAGGAAALAVIVVVLAGSGTRLAMVAAGAVFTAMLWWGPGSHELRPTGRRVVVALGSPRPVTYAVLWLLIVLGAGTYGFLESNGPTWWPFDNAPWTGWGWNR